MCNIKQYLEDIQCASYCMLLTVVVLSVLYTKRNELHEMRKKSIKNKTKKDDLTENTFTNEFCP